MNVTPDLIAELIGIATQAGQEVMKYHGGAVEYDLKDDESPITKADKASHTIVNEALGKLDPEVPVVSEEDCESHAEVDDAEHYWLVDPLDGTKEFIQGRDSFTINIALIRRGIPVAGVVYVPFSGITYAACLGHGAFRIDADGTRSSLKVTKSQNPLRIVASRDHAGQQVKRLLEFFPNSKLLSIGSSLKFCLIAEGAADLYLRDVPTMEWDTAAAHAIVNEAGGRLLVYPDKTDLGYGKKEFRNGSLLTLGDSALLERIPVL